jgi:hypothetical protein
MSPLRALPALAFVIALASPAQALDGAVLAAGLGVIRVSDGATGALVCTDAAPIAIYLVFEDGNLAGYELPTGYYASASNCATFLYPIATALECAGAPSGQVRCDALDPPRWFTLEPDGSFFYVRDNYGAHFEVEGQLTRQDAPA